MDLKEHMKGLMKWNRKIHIYLGLFLLFFIMLIGFSGLLLNHQWEFAEFWENREEASYDQTIQISGEGEQYALVHEIMYKLKLNGSIMNPGFSSDSILLNFIIAKPGTRYDIQANLDDGKIRITETKLNSWGVLRALHTTRNPTIKERSEQYPSTLASVWSVSIDIASTGLIILCLGGWYLWLKVPKKRFYLGLISVVCGSLIFVYFLLF
jgi:hypothetical protein